MYRIKILSTGKYHNWNLGNRYALFKKPIKEILKLALNDECEFKIEKFIHISGGVFCWIDIFDDKAFDDILNPYFE